jgi:hypothetical protein
MIMTRIDAVILEAISFNIMGDVGEIKPSIDVMNELSIHLEIKHL